jgi:hypothetical protein
MKNETINPKIQEFLEKYKALVDEMKVDFASYPVFVPDGQQGFKVVIQSTPIDITPKEATPSPFIPEK